MMLDRDSQMAQGRQVLIEAEYAANSQAYTYTQVSIGLWRCDRPLSNSNAPNKDSVLWLVRQDDIWMAVHAPLGASATEVTRLNREVLACWGANGQVRREGAYRLHRDQPARRMLGAGTWKNWPLPFLIQEWRQFPSLEAYLS